MPHIIVFGDSIAQGFWDPRGGWVQRLREACDRKTLREGKDYYVFNCGVSGDTAEDVLKRFDTETKARLASDKTIIIFSIGSNDAAYVFKTKKTRFTPDQFSRNISAMLRNAKKYANTIVFTGLLPVDEKKVNPIPWAPDWAYLNDDIRRFDGIIRSVCERNNIHFIDLFGQFSRLNYARLLKDGCHPNAKGHETIYRIVKEYLMRKKIVTM